MGRRLINASFAVSLVAASIFSTGTEAGIAQQSAPATLAKKSDTPTKPAVHHSTGVRRAAHKRSKRGQYRPEYSESSVEVINGGEMKRVVLEKEKLRDGSTAPAGPLKVEILNGNSTDTRYFYMDKNAPQNQAALRKEPVVVAVQSSDTRFVGGNKHPVVTGITSAEQGDAKSTSAGGDKLTNAVAPRRKRPVYQPDAH